MARVLAVTPYPTRAIELRRQDFEVLDIRRPDDLDPGVGGEISAAFVDLADLGEVRSVISAVRAAAAQVPIVVLGPHETPWQELEKDGFTLLVAPPVSFEQVAGALRSLIEPVPSSPVAPDPTPDALRPDSPQPFIDEQAQPPSQDSEPHLEDLEVHQADPASVARSSEPAAGSGPSALEPPDAPVQSPVAVPSDTARRRWTTAVLRRSPVAQVRPDEDWQLRARRLVDQVNAIPTVAELSQDFCAWLADSCPADAVAVLVRSEGRWHVEGQVGLRPLELRLEVDETDWLAKELRDGPPVVAVPDTDLLRGELAFTPLASRPRLLAVRFGEHCSILLLGRSGEPFSRSDVTLVTSCLPEFARQLDEALTVRVVAHELVRFL